MYVFHIDHLLPLISTSYSDVIQSTIICKYIYINSSYQLINMMTNVVNPVIIIPTIIIVVFIMTNESLTVGDGCLTTYAIRDSLMLVTTLSS